MTVFNIVHTQVEIQGVKVYSGKSLSSKFGRNQCLYWTKRNIHKQKKILQQKVLDLSFDLAPWKWMWHYHEAATPSCPRITFFTPRWPTLIAARGLGALLIKPRPLLGCQIKAEIKGFLLRYCLFLFLYVPFCTECSICVIFPSYIL